MLTPIMRPILQPVLVPVDYEYGDVLNPLSLFAAGEQGAWYDPSDFSTLYQDAAGTTPVTALGQPVGLMLDKSGRGNHATQSSAPSRPTVEARVNLFTKSEQFDDVAWTKAAGTISANSTTAPDGTLTADLFTESTGNSQHYVTQNAVSGTGRATLTLHVKPNGRTRVTIRSEQPQTTGLSTKFDLTGSGSVVSGTGTITALANGWYRCTATSIGNGDGTSGYHLIQTHGPADATVYTGDGVSGIYVWGAQLETGTAFTTYQRVNTATDYVDIGAPRYLSFDGTDDGMATPSIDFTGTDKMTVWAGVRKLSDAALSCLVELSATTAMNNGSFVIYAPRAAGNYASSLRGTTVAGLVVATYAAPISNVLSFKYDIGATGYLAEIVPRANAATPSIANIDGVDAGSGNFGNYPLYIGRRGGTTLPFNGRIYSLIVRGAASNAGQVAAGEAYVNSKTRAY